MRLFHLLFKSSPVVVVDVAYICSICWNTCICRFMTESILEQRKNSFEFHTYPLPLYKGRQLTLLRSKHSQPIQSERIMVDRVNLVKSLMLTDICDCRYDREDNSFRYLVNIQFVTAMGPPGGGRNPVTPRYMRHFNVLAILDFEDSTLSVVFTIIYEWWVRKSRLPHDVSSKLFLNFLTTCCVNPLVTVFES